MATNLAPQYRFKLVDTGTNTTYSTKPVWKDDVSLEYAREQGQQFFRTKLTGKLNFVGDDADWILNCSFSTKFIVIIERTNDMGSSWSEAWRGKFYMTDCDVDLDSRKVTVQPEVEDEYIDILANLDKEFDLVKLAPETRTVKVKKTPLLQIYTGGESIVSCIHNGMSWEQEVSASDDAAYMVGTCHFAASGSNREIVAMKDGAAYGSYEGTAPADPEEVYDVNFGGSGDTYFRMVYFLTIPGAYNLQATVRRTSDDEILYIYTQNGHAFDTGNMVFDMEATDLASGTLQVTITQRRVYTRLLLSVDTFNGQETYDIAPDDFCYNNRNYRKVFPYPLTSSYLVSSTAMTTTPTKWGKSGDGRYFADPGLYEDTYPIAMSTWAFSSMWFADAGNILAQIRAAGTYEMEFRVAYPIASVISVLLSQVAQGLTHAESSDYSEFLYASTNPVTGASNRTLLMSPKSNLIAGEFAQPAQKGPVTLKTVLDMLKNVFQCYWHIENGSLRIEHISWYRNGGSYSTGAGVNIDLTDMENVRNGKSWDYGTNKYSYDRGQMPQTYQFGWMDEVTEPFKGQAIDIVSPYVDEGNIEEITVSQFSSDVDYIMLAPEQVSRDGFALMSAATVEGELKLTDVSLAKNTWPWVDKDYVMQNGQLAFCFLQPDYWLYDMPARSVKVNGAVRTADGVMRTKSQEVRVPVYGDPDPMKLVRTGLGDGYVEKMSLSLTTRISKTTLKYEPE